MPKKTTKKITKPKLNPKEELFCYLYTSGGGGCFGNAGKSYNKAYRVPPKGQKSDPRVQNKDYVAGHTLLRKHKIKAYISDLLKELYNNQTVDNELLKTIIQNDDIKSKVNAIKEYNRVQERVSEGIQGDIVIRWDDEGMSKKKKK